jgi:hypothetical protein
MVFNLRTRGGRCIDDMGWRRKVGLACAKADDVFTPRLQRFRF